MHSRVKGLAKLEAGTPNDRVVSLLGENVAGARTGLEGSAQEF